MRYFFILCLMLIQVWAFSGISYAANRTALVIGNGTYADKFLPNPENDANDMADLLTDLGFDVIREINADLRTMKDAINKFGNKLVKSDVGIFYFAGHGMQIKKVNYLIPVKSALASEADAPYECVHAARVLEKMKEAGTPLNIIILDACRDNPLQQKLQSTAPSRGIARKDVPPGLAKMSAPPGSIIAYATLEGEIASDGKGRNGVYTKALLENLKNPSFSVQEVFNQTGLDVMEKTSRHQIPTTSSTPIPRFYLASGSTVVDESLVGTVLPETGSLRVSSQPSGAKILLNNSFKGHAPIDITGVAPGKYGVLGSLDGYISQGKKVRVNSGRRAMVTLYLESVITKARLFVTPNPVDAKVRIMNIPDKYYSGIELDPGRYEVEVSSSGYITKTQWVDISTSGAASGGIDLYVELEKEPEPGPGPGPALGQVWKEPVTGMKFVWVPGGEFMMGSNDGSSNEKPVHKVHLDGFWMGKYEVTQGQWQKIMGTNPSSFKSGDNYPVERVSWKDAQAFIQKLSSPSGKRFSLPTEAQWEYAARSGGKAERYSGGSNLDRVAWHDGNSGNKTHPVASKLANGLGIYDMSGNVWEWCKDVYDENAYGNHSRNNPVSTSGSSGRVLRGGGWFNSPGGCRAARRYGYDPSRRRSYYGFRLVLLSGQ